MIQNEYKITCTSNKQGILTVLELNIYATFDSKRNKGDTNSYRLEVHRLRAIVRL